MKWTTGLSRNPETTQAFSEAAQKLEVDSVGDVDVVLVFFSSHHAGQVEALGAHMRDEFSDAVCIGCNTSGVIGGGDEAIEERSLAITAGILPGVDVEPLRLEPDIHDQPEFDWHGHARLDADNTPHFLLLSDPETFDTESFLSGLDRDFPDSQKFGGLVTGGGGGNKLILEGHVFHNGAVGLALSGNLEVDTMVAQACRPIGEPLIVTSHTHNVIHRFDRGDPVDIFRSTVGKLDEEDRELSQHSMFVGMGLDLKDGEYKQGDFLIRDIVGFNPKTGDLAVAAAVNDLDVIQFHLMDARTSAQEFARLMDEYNERSNGAPRPSGALLFSCVERGEEFYGHPNHESTALREHLGEVPIGGCFCDGEIGPIGQKTFLHGYASTVVVFREAGEAE